MQKLIFGLETKSVNDINKFLTKSDIQPLDFVVLPLFHPRLRRDNISISDARLGPITRSDQLLSCNDWISNIVGEISTWLDCDNSNENMRKSSDKSFFQEINWSIHLGLQAVLLPCPTSRICPNYARNLQRICASSSYLQLWVRIPVSCPLNYNNYEDNENLDGWIIWDNLASSVDYHHKLSIVLEITEDISDKVMESINRWTGEPVKGVIIPIKFFVMNKKGFPVLSKDHQKLLKVLLKYKLHIIYTGNSKFSDGYKLYSEYISYLQKQACDVIPEAEKFIQSYKDTLQAPLQPLMDNLESQTYETFERDKIKYDQYERAISAALISLQSKNISNIVVMVVGAGRGPLVSCALSASVNLGLIIKVYAIEKNANAVITLKNRVITDKWSNVTIICQDMRYYQGNEKADIIVSELLGSWGDNELSPECLDGIQKYLKLPHGIMIPTSYTSYVAPMSSSRLWKGAKDMPNGNGLDCPYVVKFHNCNVLTAAQRLFTFEHPNPSQPIDNSRYFILNFKSPYETRLHGFAGTFQSCLYDNINLSIEPKTHTPGMFSWFPIFIPLFTPIKVKENDVITVHIWRCVDDRKVWYEWCISSPLITPIQNSGGKSYWIGL